MPDVFLSYSREDQDTARRFAEGLQREGFEVWWDQTLRSGQHYDRVTEKALKSAKAVVVLWSRTSVESRWVRAEATIADRNGSYVPVMIESCDRPVMFELTQSADLLHWKGDGKDKSWRALVEDVRQFVNQPAPAGSVEIAHAAPLLQGRTARPVLRVVAILLAAILLCGVVFALWRGYRGDSSGIPAVAGPATITVVRFADYSESRDQGYLAEGLTEELSTALSRVPDLTVIGRTSALEFKGPDDLRAAFGDAPPTWLLEGSVRRAGELLRVTAKLINSKTGVQHWNEQYDRKVTDVFALQQDIATAIATALRVPLGQVGVKAASRTSVNQQDYSDYLRARSLRRQLQFDDAIPLLEAVVKRNPQYAAAWAQLGYAYTLGAYRAVRSLGPDATDAQRLALVNKELTSAELASRKAIELDRNLADGYLALGYVVARRGKRIEADELFRKALELDPGQPDALQEYMVLLIMAGRTDKALETGRRLLELEPFLPVFRGWVTYGLLNTGRPAEAIQLLHGIPDDALDYGFPWKNLMLARAYAAENRYAEAAAQLRRIASVPEANLFIEGPVDAASAQLAARLIERAPESAGKIDLKLPTALIFVYAFTQDGELLASAFQRSRGPSVFPNVWAPWMKSVRATAAFRDGMRQSGLVEYWKRFGWADRCHPVGTEDFECD